MVSFDGHLEGTPLEVWQEDGRRDRLPSADVLAGVQRVLVVAAHADDETLGCAATIALARRRRLAVDVVVVTDGAASHGEPSPSIAAERRSEARAALDRLGDGIGLAFLEVPDSATPEHRDRIADEVRRRASGPAGTVLVLSTWEGDGHRDHRVVGEVCAEAGAACGQPVLAAPIWLWHWARPDDSTVPWSSLLRVEADGDARARRRAALGEYGSQTRRGADGAAAVLHPLFLRHFLGDDHLLRVAG
ncbi:PIG-L family deacetylase [Rathayibacter caricis]|uniref:PIG-L deacetylase family protein n=1 Tax=Rathayibacter caricis TaxID=110936 RepID=UPI001FB52513|nr:PIG-L deacetylase family protein [Rathayibacter caricis]MCJ1696456.1 PIG-L family deacetylase [Rathayibacter caricis]